MFHLRRSDRRSSRGQALVETALVLPILALLLVMALDVGRVFFGWIALQNAARIGADFASQTPQAWDGMPSGELDKRNRYSEVIEADLRTINCDLETGTVPDPTFVNVVGDPTPYDDGDYAVVELLCEFDLITPLATTILGGPINMGAHEEFPVNRRIVQGIPPAPPPPPECEVGEIEMPDLVTERMDDAFDLWTGAGFDPDNFHPPDGVVTSGPNKNDNKLVLTQSLEEGECQLEDATVTVTHT